jgi:hypothetical protein
LRKQLDDMVDRIGICANDLEVFTSIDSEGNGFYEGVTIEESHVRKFGDGDFEIKHPDDVENGDIACVVIWPGA